MSKAKQANLIMCYPLACGDLGAGEAGCQEEGDGDRDLGQSIIYGVSICGHYQCKPLFMLCSIIFKAEGKKPETSSLWLCGCYLWPLFARLPLLNSEPNKSDTLDTYCFVLPYFPLPPH